ncbi:MAG: hypothetical protein Q4P66_01275 [Actinomycetaceae bacterium]|nr:hypothetical protein [Actinomycetaceae bacterium]
MSQIDYVVVGPGQLRTDTDELRSMAQEFIHLGSIASSIDSYIDTAVNNLWWRKSWDPLHSSRYDAHEAALMHLRNNARLTDLANELTTMGQRLDIAAAYFDDANDNAAKAFHGITGPYGPVYVHPASDTDKLYDWMDSIKDDPTQRRITKFSLFAGAPQHYFDIMNSRYSGNIVSGFTRHNLSPLMAGLHRWGNDDSPLMVSSYTSAGQCIVRQRAYPQYSHSYRNNALLPSPCRGLKKPEPTSRAHVPSSISKLVQHFDMEDLDDDRARIRVLEHQRDGKRSSYTVIIPGTQTWSPWSAHPQNLNSNIQAAAGYQSDAEESVKAALNSLDIQPGDSVELAGYSQGGIVAARLCEDKAFTKKYHVVSALTIGSPTFSMIPNKGIQMLSIENSHDIVPQLDGVDNMKSPQITTVKAHIESDTKPSRTQAHHLKYYKEISRSLDSSNDLSIEHWNQHRDEKLGLDQRLSKTKIHDFAVFHRD